MEILKMTALLGSAIVWDAVAATTPKEFFLLVLLIGFVFGAIWFLAYEFWKTE